MTSLTRLSLSSNLPIEGHSLVLGTDVSELDRLLGGKVDNDVSVRSSLMGILDSLLLSVSHQGVEISHEQDRSLETLSTCFSDIFEDIGVIDTVFDSDLHDQLKRFRRLPGGGGFEGWREAYSI